jgi:hypothetical protein
LFLGQRLHQTPDAPLEKFGLFNGNRIILVGDKVCCIKKMINFSLSNKTFS